MKNIEQEIARLARDRVVVLRDHVRAGRAVPLDLVLEVLRCLNVLCDEGTVDDARWLVRRVS